MDKNTITGLVLMAAVMFGFLWMSKPSEAELAAEQARQEQALEAEKAAAEASRQAAMGFSTADSVNLVAAIRLMGSEADGVYTYTGDNLSLTADGQGLAGTYTTSVGPVDILPVLNGTSQAEPAALKGASRAIRTLIDRALKYEGFAKYLGGDNHEYTLENDLVRITISSRGGMISQAELKDYKSEVKGDTTNVFLFRTAEDGYSFRLNTAEQRLDTREFNFEPVVEGDSVVTMLIRPSSQSYWGLRYILDKDAYTVHMQVIQKGMDAVMPANTSSIDFHWHQKMARNEVGRTFEERNSAIYYKYVGETPDDLNANKDDSESLTGAIRWVAFKNQFFSSVIIARNQFSSAELVSKDIKDNDFLKDMTMTATVPATTSNGVVASFDWYLGPNDYPILDGLGKKLGYDKSLDLTRLIPLGWSLFRWINTLIVIPVFDFLGSFIKSYGLIIFLLTVFIKLILFPFTFKSFKSQAKMRVLAPEIKEINEKYPGQENALKRNQETMALYSKAGASPFSGCLPMLLQMPVLIAMFSFFPSAIELRGQSFLWAHDLSAPDYICTLPFTIPFYGNRVSLFCLLMTIINVVYMKISMSSQPGGNSMPGMKLMQYMMPVMFLFFFNDYASALSYYYLLSLLITIIQTWIFRRIIDEKKVRAEMMANAKKPKKKSKWMARLEEAQRQQQAAMRQQQNAQGNRAQRRSK